MSQKPTTPAQLARLEKQKVASTEGAKALADHQANSVAVRKNMERLRALRMAKEAEDAARAPAEVASVKKKASSKSSGKSPNAKAKSSKAKSSEPKAQQLSEWLTSQKTSGRPS
jgi:hypothetical protein